ncbi:hypothetical protein AAVH_29843 [Aphelenchoides avenae]|nr:hypothetical protein AAVH_29843 [Aphelenchus avenae]
MVWKIILNEAYDQSDRDPNAPAPQEVMDDIKKTGVDIRAAEGHAETQQRSLARARALIEKFKKKHAKKSP